MIMNIKLPVGYRDPKSNPGTRTSTSAHLVGDLTKTVVREKKAPNSKAYSVSERGISAASPARAKLYPQSVNDLIGPGPRGEPKVITKDARLARLYSLFHK
jgi:hypothetical protein